MRVPPSSRSLSDVETSVSIPFDVAQGTIRFLLAIDVFKALHSLRRIFSIKKLHFSWFFATFPEIFGAWKSETWSGFSVWEVSGDNSLDLKLEVLTGGNVPRKPLKKRERYSIRICQAH